MTIKKGTSTIATGSSVEWGGVEGTLSDQTDLKNALDAKAPTLSPAFTGAPTAPTAEEGTNTTQIATTEFVKTAIDNLDALPDQTDMAGKYLATDGINAYWKSPAGLPLLSHIWSDHLLNDASFLRADTFSWQSGLVYKSAYKEIEDEYNAGTNTSETIGSNTINYRVTPKGYKIVVKDTNYDGETAATAIYNDTGVAWYYIFDYTNQRFKLPRTKYGFTGLRDAVGKYVEPGLPNITGGRIVGVLSTAETSLYGAFDKDWTATNGSVSNGDTRSGYSFDASRSNSIYGNSTTVQPPATQMYLYFYAGNTVRNETEIDVGEITEALNGKLDQDLSNASANFKETIVGWGMPDYSTAVSKTNTGFTADKKGFILATTGTMYNSGSSVSINGTVIWYCSISGTGASIEHASWLIPVDVNDIITTNNIYTLAFIEMKGL